MIHWTKLKKAVEEAGGTWTNREEAETFLAGQGLMPADEPDVVFDDSKPYGVIVGSDDRWPGARFSQGGHLFNAQGKKVG